MYYYGNKHNNEIETFLENKQIQFIKISFDCQMDIAEGLVQDIHEKCVHSAGTECPKFYKITFKGP